MAELSDDLLLRVENLILQYRSVNGIVRAVDGVSFDIRRGEAMAILGETGCGKTSLTRALLRSLPQNVNRFSGRIFLEGRELMSMDDERFYREVCWVRISLVMQAAMNALNPVIRVGEQVAEPLRIHLRWSRKRAMDRAAEIFRLVGLPADFLTRYPFELSGGMRQRTVLAMALIAEPALVILDEPTSALDILSQGNIFNVLKRIKREQGTSFLLITHDIAASSELADRVALMYAGQMVELSSAEHFFREPAHPYAKLLLESVPRLNGSRQPRYIPGRPPNMFNLPSGCRFAERCPSRMSRCMEEPVLREAAGQRQVRCWLFGNGREEQEK